jgi:AcrR family transcriptional regulator
MKSWPVNDVTATGLRERKKAKTQAAIRAEAFRLFREQGYAATTIEQIAEAAEVSPSTFFRYFPTKEDVVLHDALDPLMIRELERQPAELSVIQALRQGTRSVLASLTPEELEIERQREALILSVPELRAKSLSSLADTLGMLSEIIGKRVGRDPADFAVRNFAGAIIGVAIAAVFGSRCLSFADYMERMDTGMAHLEAGLPL